MGKKIRRKVMSLSQNEEQTKQSAPDITTTPEQETSWISENWKYLLGIILGLVLLMLSFFAVVQSTANTSYNAGFRAGVETTISQYENSPWYSRWWAGITGSFPGRK